MSRNSLLGICKEALSVILSAKVQRTVEPDWLVMPIEKTLIGPVIPISTSVADVRECAVSSSEVFGLAPPLSPDRSRASIVCCNRRVLLLDMLSARIEEC